MSISRPSVSEGSKMVKVWLSVVSTYAHTVSSYSHEITFLCFPVCQSAIPLHHKIHNLQAMGQSLHLNHLYSVTHLLASAAEANMVQSAVRTSVARSPRRQVELSPAEE